MQTILLVVKLTSSILSTIMSSACNISLCRLILQLLLFNNVICFVIKEYHPEERDALLLLRESVTSAADLHSNWTGPPCIVDRSRWKGITCSNWHVISIDLEGINVVGSLPPMFLQNITFLRQLNLRNNLISGVLPNLTNLVILEQVLLSYNHFGGSIPAEYVELPGLRSLELQENYLEGEIPAFDQPLLTTFNVSYNHLRGPIPETNVLLRFPKSSFDNNSDLCGKPLDELCPAPPPAPPSAPSPQIIAPSPAEGRKKKKLPVWSITLIAAAGGLLILLLFIALMFCNKRKKEKEKTGNESAGYTFGVWAQKIMSLPERTEDPGRLSQLQFFNKELPVFDLDDLLRSSAEVLGKGNLGTTYKATLETGIVVAVKKLNYMNELSKREFLHQMQLLGKTKHENLVEIISFYYSEKDKLVIYEFFSDGTLFELLHENRGAGRVPLDWATRMSMIKDIAKGLAFLHNSLSSQRGLHANLKSSNVLIHQHSQGCHSKLTNFGFLPLLSSRKYAEMLAISRSPEFVQGKKFTPQADIYCFGIILLEIITGKVPGETLGDMEEETTDLSEWVRTVVYNDWSTDILDMEILAAKEAHDAMLQLTELALECTDMTPEKRPEMNQVLRKIEEIEQMREEND